MTGRNPSARELELERLAHVLRNDTAGMERDPYVNLCRRVATALTLSQKHRAAFLTACEVTDGRA